MTAPVLEVINLQKRFGAFEALRGVNFSLERGQTLGLLGPNGAGKTTTIHILLGITLEDSGAISYFGRDFKHYREESLERVNFASAYNMLLGRLTVRENLLVFASLYKIPDRRRRVEELSGLLEARDLLNQRFWDLSAGQKTKVVLIKSLLNDPEILLLDEPTASLDPDVADKMLSLIEGIRHEKNISILFTSHNMSEVTRVCDEVIILNRGEIVAQGGPRELSRQIDSVDLDLHIAESDAAKAREALEAARLEFTFTGESVVQVHLREEDLAGAVVSLHEAGVRIQNLDVHHPTLEDVFIRIARGEE